MNNEIGRKLTSLTLMTIMLAGGMTIAAPSMMVPEAAAAGALYVSAENALFNNSFGGAQIVEVVVIGISTSTDIAAGEPVVKVNDNQLRMAQATDGNWYGYFGSETEVEAADCGTETLNSSNGPDAHTDTIVACTTYLDFGMNHDPEIIQGDFNEASDVMMQKNATQVMTALTNTPTLSNWNNTDNTNRQPNSVGTDEDTNYSVGQIGVNSTHWPFIQLYDLTIETFEVVLEQAGADEVVTLNYDSGDMDDYAGMVLDRNSASQGSDIHLTITDNQLNIDPTAEDIVSFYVGGAADERGVSWMNRTLNEKGAAAWAATDYLKFDNSFDDNGVLLINNATNGGDSVLVNIATADDATADNLIIFYEGGENSGIFYATDDADNANIEVATAAKRGFTATFDYNDSAQSFVVANDFGVITMDASSVGDVWNSGEALTVTLIDQDLNKNTASSEDLYLVNTTIGQPVPALQIGNPLSVLDSATNVTSVDAYSKIAYYTEASPDINLGNTQNITISTGYTGTQLLALNSSTIATDNTYFNYNLVGFTNSTNDVVGVCLTDSTAHAGTSGWGLWEPLVCDSGNNKGIVK